MIYYIQNGVEVETDTYRNTNISFRDIGSQMIPLWDSYLPKAKKIIVFFIICYEIEKLVCYRFFIKSRIT